MKQFTVASLFFLFAIVNSFFYSCNNITDNEISLKRIKQIDSLNNYYSVAVSSSFSKEKKLEALDTFLKGTEKLKIDSLKCKGLYLQSKLLNKYVGPKIALEKTKVLLQFAQKNNDSFYIGRAFYRQGFYNKKQNNFLKAFGYYNQSFKIHRDLGDSIYAGKSLFAMANIQKTLGDYNASKTSATDGLKYLENSKEYRMKAGLFQSISLAFKELGDYEEAFLWSDKINHLLKDSIALKKIGVHNIPIFKNTMANILAEQKKYGESIGILQSLLKEKTVIQQRTQYALILNNFGYVKFLQDKENKESKAILLKALEIRDEERDVFGLFSSNIHLSKFYKNKDVSKAKHHAREAYENVKDFNDYEALLEVLTLITELEPSSLKDLQRFKDASLNLMKLRKKTREIYAPTRFENENLLKENEEKNRKIIEVRNQNTIYLLGMLLLLSGIGFAIYFFRQRTQHLAQQNKMVQFQASYETETRISKRLHDELGNDIFQVMLQYQNDPHDPQIKEKLNTSYLKARDISRENNEFETDETFSEELNNMLHNYTQNGIQLMARGLDRIDWDHISKPIKITVYRVLQELMTNMQKHSKAKLVVLIFSNIDNVLRIKYSDNGVGVTKEHLQSKNGLRNTEKRIQAIQGTLIFESEKDKGFKAEIKIPN
ncbi:ATP-binding protein [Aquimarina aggregata]|uniref:ATP-binding protein n=1 Tax=Aquimarina aggregata TaxID=1642818 RepID=UPI0024912A53|nr:ATP-binding protein [Aquimarina aggregata]